MATMFKQEANNVGRKRATEEPLNRCLSVQPEGKLH
jgi:hypothetical protein